MLLAMKSQNLDNHLRTMSHSLCSVSLCCLLYQISSQNLTPCDMYLICHIHSVRAKQETDVLTQAWDWPETP